MPDEKEDEPKPEPKPEPRPPRARIETRKVMLETTIRCGFCGTIKPAGDVAWTLVSLDSIGYCTPACATADAPIRLAARPKPIGLGLPVG